MKTRLIGYNAASAGLISLAEKIKELSGEDAKRFGPSSLFVQRARAGSYSPTENELNVCWGNIGGPIKTKKKMLCLNNVDTTVYTDKKKFLETFRNDYTIPYFNTYSTALSAWRTLKDMGSEGPLLVERHVLSGHSGEGIRLVDEDNPPDSSAKLWTRYVKKKREFRVHFCKSASIFGGFDFYYQEKKLKKSALEETIPNRFQIRNLAHGWVYTRAKEIPESISKAARSFVSKSKNLLTFGAIDIIWNAASGNTWILEVNLAPGLAPSTCDFYATHFLNLAKTHWWDAVTNGTYCRNMEAVSQNLETAPLAPQWTDSPPDPLDEILEAELMAEEEEEESDLDDTL